MNLIYKSLRLKYGILSFLCPGNAARQAFNMFQHPRSITVREREKKFYEKARILRIPYEPEEIILFETGNEAGEKVLLIHGWESNPGSMGGIAEELVNQGFHVFSLNIPAHGISKLKTTTMLHVSILLADLIKGYFESEKISVVTHSFGSGAISFALSRGKISLKNMVFITSPEKIYDIFADFADKINLNEKALEKLIAITETKFDFSLEGLQISSSLQNSDFEKLLLIHDRYDTVLPYENVININRLVPNSDIFTTEGKGHYRLLWDKQVIKRTVKFLMQ
jgi:pimeloyl-ACP methyl ester carboxylesterase